MREGSLNWQAQGPTWRTSSSGIGLATDRAWAWQDTQTQKLRDASTFPATAAFAASTERHSAANTNVRLSITDTANGLGDSTSAWTVAAKVWPKQHRG